MKSSLSVLYVGNNPGYFQPLENKGEIELKTVSSSVRGIKYLSEGNKTDVIFSDFCLSGSNGLFFFDWLRTQPGFDKIPFILLSKEFRSEIYKTAYQKKVDDYYSVSQPVPEDISTRLRFLVNFKKKKGVYVDEKASAKFSMPLSKRLFDIAVSATALLLLSPILLLVILAIRLESKGKVYYISRRVGRKPFDFYKLRSMRTGADSQLKALAKIRNQYADTSANAEVDFSLPCPRCSNMPDGQSCSPILYIKEHAICDFWHNEQQKNVAAKNSVFVKIKDDPRVTRVGKFIRNTSIDELPQLINVLKGDMSIVGNRPLPVYEAEQLTRDDLSKRFLAPAGITGLWQVELRGKGGVMSEDERKRLDNEYAEHFKDGKYSFWYDVKLMLRTIPAMFQKDSV
jgi:lipopolysaccharide/colanic/teichoic acid biosynthesis glycosyltransferase